MRQARSLLAHLIRRCKLLCWSVARLEGRFCVTRIVGGRGGQLEGDLRRRGVVVVLSDREGWLGKRCWYATRIVLLENSYGMRFRLFYASKTACSTFHSHTFKR